MGLKRSVETFEGFAKQLTHKLNIKTRKQEKDFPLKMCNIALLKVSKSTLLKSFMRNTIIFNSHILRIMTNKLHKC